MAIQKGYSEGLLGLPAEGMQLMVGPLHKQEEVLLSLISFQALEGHWTAALPLL